MEKRRSYDLEKRTSKFGEEIITFVKTVPKDVITRPLITQLIKAGTSIGANYCEANDAESKKDFCHKLGITRKESKETCFWLQMIAKACPESKQQGRILWKEAKELNLIFSSIIRKARSSNPAE